MNKKLSNSEKKWQKSSRNHPVFMTEIYSSCKRGVKLDLKLPTEGEVCAFVLSPLPWQKSSCKMVWSSESVLRVRSNSGPTFGSRAPFTHWSWDDVTRLIRASEIYTNTHRQVNVCRHAHVAMEKTHMYAGKEDEHGKRHVQSNKHRKWERLHLNMLASLRYPPWIQNSFSVLGSVPLAWLHYIVSDRWNEASISAVQIFKDKIRPLVCW